MRPAGTAAMLNIAWIGSFSEASVKLVCHVGSGDKRDALVNVSRSWSPSRLRRASAAQCQKRFQSKQCLVTEQDTGCRPSLRKTALLFPNICQVWTDLCQLDSR